MGRVPPTQRFESIRFDPVRFGPSMLDYELRIKFSQIRCAIRFGSIRSGSVRFGPVRFGSLVHAVAQFGRILAIRIELPNWAPRFELPTAMNSERG